jgi:uncharacterized protein (TIGR02996 family)
MHEETPFITAIQAEAAPDITYLVYADWLDEHGHADRAEYVRLCVELPKLWAKFRAERVLDPYVEQIATAQIRMRELRATFSPDWVKQVSRAKYGPEW